MSDLNFNDLTDAQKRLFAVRCARRVQHLMKDPRSIAALDVAELHALGQATDEELNKARDAANAAERAAARNAACAAWAASDAASDAARAAASDAAWAAWAAASDAEREAQAKLLEEIRGMR